MPPDTRPLQPAALDAAKDRPDTSAAALAWLAEPRVILGLIGLYIIAHFMLRLALSPTLGIDDAEQILFAQHWAFGYRFRQPPLFTWMLLPVIELIGPGIVAVSLVRYALLAITFVFLYLTARLCLQDQRLAGLAGLSFAAIYVFAYYAHHDLTHTTALAAMIALLLYVTARLAQTPNWSAYLAAGLVIGLGLLAKWNFAMLAIGLPLTCLLLPAYRHLVLTPKVVLSIVIAAAMVTPTALWMLAHDQSVQAVSSDILAKDGVIGAGTPWLEGGGALLRSILLFPLPFLPLFLAIFGRNLLAPAHDAATGKPPALTPAFFGCLMLVVLGLHVLLIPAFGAVAFTERWLHPALMALPIWLFALAERIPPTPRQITAFLASIAILVAVAATARLYRYVEGVDDCGRCREFAPFVELAEGLRATGFSHGTIVADGMHIGGNLRMLFADSRVIDPAFPRTLWPDAENRAAPGDCLLVWRDDSDGAHARRDRIEAYAETRAWHSSGRPSVGTTGRLGCITLSALRPGAMRSWLRALSRRIPVAVAKVAKHHRRGRVGSGPLTSAKTGSASSCRSSRSTNPWHCSPNRSWQRCRRTMKSV